MCVFCKQCTAKFHFCFCFKVSLRISVSCSHAHTHTHTGFNPFIFTALIEIFSIIFLTLMYVSHLFYFYFNLFSVLVSFPVSFPPSPPSLLSFLFQYFCGLKVTHLIIIIQIGNFVFFYQHWQSIFFTASLRSWTVSGLALSIPLFVYSLQWFSEKHVTSLFADFYYFKTMIPLLLE